MALGKPFRAVPITLGKRYRKIEHRKQRTSVATVLGRAALIGVLVGLGSVAVQRGSASSVLEVVTPLAVSAGVVRARTPQPGDYWPRCSFAKAAGTAPIYRGEPGYRSGMDGDSDGVACEPYRGF